MVRKLVAPTHYVPTARIARRAVFHARDRLQIALHRGRRRTLQRIRRVIEITTMPLSVTHCRLLAGPASAAACIPKTLQRQGFQIVLHTEDESRTSPACTSGGQTVTAILS